MADAPKTKKKKAKAKDADPRSDSLSPEDMAALLDEAIGDDDDLEVEIDGDDDNDDATSLAAIAAIISSAHLPSAPAPAEPAAEEPSLEVASDPADEPTPPTAWNPVDDLEAADIELIATEEPIADHTEWEDVQDGALEDLEISAAMNEETPDPWGPLGATPTEPDVGVLTVPPVTMELGPPVALLMEAPEATPIPTASPVASTDTLPWRGTARITNPDLPDQLYVADVTQESSHLLVAAWELVEDEPGGRLLRVRLTDDGHAIELEATAPHEPAVALEVTVEGHTLAVRAALTIERGERGLRLGRDVLAGRFTVDPSTSNWPKPTED